MEKMVAGSQVWPYWKLAALILISISVYVSIIQMNAWLKKMRIVFLRKNEYIIGLMNRSCERHFEEINSCINGNFPPEKFIRINQEMDSCPKCRRNKRPITR